MSFSGDEIFGPLKSEGPNISLLQRKTNMSKTRNPNPDTINPEPFLPCERLDVYRLSLEFRRSLAILDSVRNIASQRDQIFRASDSIVLNIAEGAGRMAQADKRRHYSYAKGSAMKAAIPRGGFGETKFNVTRTSPMRRGPRTPPRPRSAARNRLPRAADDDHSHRSDALPSSCGLGPCGPPR